MKSARLKKDLKYYLLNYFIMFIPSWQIRKLFLKMFGMKIGKGSRIGICTKIDEPKKIVIGNRTVINEWCHLDGRGGIRIGDDVSISNYSIIITASHKKSDANFEYYEDGVIIENNVWIGTRAMVLNGSHMKEKSVLSAGSTFKGVAEENKVYIQGRDWDIRNRNLENDYTINYKAYFR